MSMRRLTIFIAHCSDLLTDHRPHGDGLIAYGFIRHLAERGHILHIAVQETDLRSTLPEGVTLHYIKPRRSGLAGRVDYMLRLRSLFNQLSLNNTFDLVHQLNPVFVGVSLSLAGCRVPIVLGTFVARWPDYVTRSSATRFAVVKQFASRIVRNAIAGVQQSQAGALLLTTPAAQNRLPFLKRSAKKIYSLPHGIDATLFRPAEDWDTETRLASEQSRPSILFLANVWRRKGIFDLLEAFAKLAPEFPTCRLTVAGGGADLAAVKDTVSTMDCRERIDFVGHVDRNQTPGLYQEATLYCLPSLGEPYATTVLEAMSCGRALVVTNAGGLPYMIGESGGVLAPPEDPAALASAIASLLSSPDTRRAMGKANRERILQTMTWNSVATQLESIYEQVLTPEASRIRGTVTTSEAVPTLHSPGGEINI